MNSPQTPAEGRCCRPEAYFSKPWYSENVKNITVSLPDDMYRRARVRAAEEDTSVSALVQRLLIAYTQEESEYERRKRLQAEVLATIGDFRASDRLARDEVHRRR